jgi:hypothetical protein
MVSSHPETFWGEGRRVVLHDLLAIYVGEKIKKRKNGILCTYCCLFSDKSMVALYIK